MRTLIGALFFLLIPLDAALAASTLRGDLPRTGDRPLEVIAGLDSIYDNLVTRDRVRLRTILTQPAGNAERLPAILFVQWLSCDTIELPESEQSGWGRMMRRIARESGLVMMRTEKRGVGDSEGGPCSALDYETELSDHRAALARLKASEHVDPNRTIVFGASMGGTYAPLVALDRDVAGIIVWGAGARTWFERMVSFERSYRELSGATGETLNAEMKSVSAFLFAYLVEGRSPRTIAAEGTDLGAVWARLVGTEGDLHYGRPLSFHQQAQRQDWTRAWSRVDDPVLVLHGEYDWYEDRASAALIARIVNARRPGRARFVAIPRTDHHFDAYPRVEDAVAGSNGSVNEDPAVREVLAWLREVLAAPKPR